MVSRLWPVVLLLSGTLGLQAGCGSGSSGGDASAPAIKDPKQELFEMHCAKCHAQAGEPGGPQMGSSKGPNLAHVGSGQGHTAEWLAKVIRNPKSVRFDSKMPKFEGILKDEEIKMLADYLAAKK